MKEVFLLVKNDFMKIFSPLVNIRKWKSAKDDKWKFLFMPLLWAWFLFVVIKMVGFFYKAYSATGQIDALFYILTLMVSTFIIFNIVPYSTSRLYYNSEMEQLLHLPIKSVNIIKSSMLFLSLSQIAMSLCIFVPALVRFQQDHSVPALYLPINILNLIFCSTILVSIVCLLWIYLMLLVSRFKRSKNLVQFVFLLSFTAFVIVMTPFFSLGLNPDAGRGGYALATQSGTIAQQIASYLPFIENFTAPMHRFETGKALLLLSINFVLSVLSVEIVSRLAFRPWLKGYNNSKGSQTKKRKKGIKMEEMTGKEQSVMMTLVKKEFTNIFKTPIYVFNIAIPGILMPLFIMLPLIMQGGAKKILMQIPKMDEIIRSLGLSPLNTVSFCILIGMALSTFFSISGSSSASSISREGKQIWLLQSLPIPASTQVAARILTASIFSLLECIPMIATLTYLLKPAAYLVPFFFVGAFFSSFAINCYCLMIDISRPKLTWKDPQGAIKQNFNMFICMVLDFAYIALNGFAAYFLFSRGIVSMQTLYLYVLGLALFNLLLGVGFYRANITKFGKKLPQYQA
ncbi:MAG: hypothetical protein Q4A72_06210 [Bacillota bacterium]|nr:hypothetical protein [Bacillota bacterium]